ncbi:MAG: Fic family protein [Burkholderiales bacterium]|jgi:Fic family protein|nr:Fic family protein [Rhodocyclaceae bacterium]MCA3167512.1 Fic family protein [Burkholderiales bacterium]MCE2724608.1 Fic family protein [Betaproteobacteria bacterium]
MPAELHLWVWQSTGWPPIKVDVQALSATLGRTRSELGKLLGKIEAVGKADIALSARDIWTQDALATAAIEGEALNLDAVRSSVAKRLGVASDYKPAVPRDIEGLLDVMEDAATKWDTDLTEERLFSWHHELFPQEKNSLRQITPGQYRVAPEPMQIVSGRMTREKVHYEAPPSVSVPIQMRKFLTWFNATRDDGQTDGLVRAALAHLWFESIHPFEDGNGRIGRAILDMAIAQDMRSNFRMHGLSIELRDQQQQYYDALNRVQRCEADPSSWTIWLLDSLRLACQSSSRVVDQALDRARFWSRHRDVDLNERQRKVLNKMLEAGPGGFEGGMTPKKLQSIASVAGATATRDLVELVEKGLMVRRAAGRSTRYELALEGWEWKPIAPRSNSSTKADSV